MENNRLSLVLIEAKLRVEGTGLKHVKLLLERRSRLPPPPCTFLARFLEGTPRVVRSEA